jgi:AraC-like DNA-binding protein/predicted transcriptional regulator YdeE
MNWFEMINKATDYIEEHITEDIDLEDIAKKCHVSYHYFSKTFTMITGYTLKEYIRNRRITLASYEVSNTDHRILDIGIKYGYSSNEAFSRAFKKIHGINPSQARKEHVTVYTHFPVLTYEVPKQNILSLRYDIIRDIKRTFIGKQTLIEISDDEYERKQLVQECFLNDFMTTYPSNHTVYRILYDLNIDYSHMRFFVGYEIDDYQKPADALEQLIVQAPKAVRFIAKGITENHIPDIKLIIYNEWQKNDFVADLICELEYIVKQPNGTVDFYYIVSIE